MENRLRMIDAVCPACHTHKLVTEEKNGCEIQCRQCGKTFVVRMADQQLKSWDTPVYAAPSKLPKKSELPSAWQSMRWQILLGAAMLLIIVVLAVFSFFHAPHAVKRTGVALGKSESSRAADDNRLGEKLLEGIGIATDVPQAIELFRKSAENGNLDAQCNLARCFLIGKGVEQSSEKAFELYLQAARSGSFVAQNAVGEFFDAGIAEKRDMAEAVKWYQLAAAQRYAPAQFNLGVCYAEGVGVEKDPQKAVAFYQLAAKHGYAPALNNLGLCYARGFGVARDDGRAANLFFRAASLGNVEGKFNCGAACCTGRGRKQDLAQGFRFFRDAAERGCTPAQYNLAVYYENAIIVKKNPTRACFWYRRALENGDDRAGKALLEINGQ